MKSQDLQPSQVDFICLRQFAIVSPFFQASKAKMYIAGADEITWILDSRCMKEFLWLIVLHALGTWGDSL